MHNHRFAIVFLVCGLFTPASVRAETVSMSSIGCDDLDATLMAEQALQDKISGKDHNALDRIHAYQNKAGPDSCRPLSQGDKVAIIRDQADMVCVHEADERLNGPNAPDCYWMRRRHIKLPN